MARAGEPFSGEHALMAAQEKLTPEEEAEWRRSDLFNFPKRIWATVDAARAETATATARLREYEQLTTVVVRGQHGEGVEVPATPEHIRQALEQAADLSRARPLDDYHEDLGDVLWWMLPVQEAPYCGSPLNSDWPGYHTHWTPLPPCPVEPAGEAPHAG